MVKNTEYKLQNLSKESVSNFISEWLNRNLYIEFNPGERYKIEGINLHMDNPGFSVVFDRNRMLREITEENLKNIRFFNIIED